MKTFKGLLDRLYDIQGVPFVELAKAHDIAWNEEPARNKGLTGRIVEATLDKAPDSNSEPDLTYLGLEIKSIPIADGCRPLEHTKITSLNHVDVADQEWERSTVYHKLRNILFVPVVKYELDRPDRWYIRSPFVWMPSINAEEGLRDDYEAVRKRILDGASDDLTSAKPPKGFCDSLIPNTAGQNKNDTVTFSIDDREHTVRRRAWMLRKDFTERVLRENIAYQHLGHHSERSS